MWDAGQVFDRPGGCQKYGVPQHLPRYIGNTDGATLKVWGSGVQLPGFQSGPNCKGKILNLWTERSSFTDQNYYKVVSSSSLSTQYIGC